MSTRRKFSFLLGLAVATGANAAVTSSSDITQWVGTGANWSALVIDFNSGVSTDSFAWGYRWDEPTDPVVISGADMLVAIAAADPNLSITYSGSASENFFLTEISYKSFSVENDDFVTDFNYWSYFVAGGSSGVGSYDDAYDPDAPEPQIWDYANGGSNLPSSWESAKSGAGDTSGGITGRILSDGSWDSWVFGDGNTVQSGPIAAAPEPSSAALILSTATLFFVNRRRRN